MATSALYQLLLAEVGIHLNARLIGEATVNDERN
jgi:hypothetical protein